MRTFGGFFLLFFFASRLAYAQTATNSPADVGHGSAGGGVFIDLSGDEPRAGSHDGVVGPLWFLYGSVFVAPRVALGVELATLGSEESTSQYTGLGGTIAVTKDQISASAIYGVIRVRAVKSARLGLDLIAGLGRQNGGITVTTTAPEAAPQRYDYGDSFRMYALGADAPISVAPHFVVSPFTRVYLLHEYPRSRSDSSAQTAFAVGVTAGVKW